MEDDETEDESEYNPSEAEETQSETYEGVQPRKRSRLEDGSSSNNVSVVVHIRKEQQNSGTSLSRPAPGKRASGLVSRTTNSNQPRLAASIQDAGEGSSRGGGNQVEPPIQYLHTLTRSIPRAGPPPGMERAQIDHVERSKVESSAQDNVPSPSRAEHSAVSRL